MQAPSKLVEALKSLDQKIKDINGGRPSTVITTAISYVERDDLESAKAVLLNDRDKLWQYDGETRCISILENLGMLPPRMFYEESLPSPFDLLRVEAIKKFLVDHPREGGPGSVLEHAILYLERGDETHARYKIMLDSDKFLDSKAVLQFADQWDLISPEYRERLVRARVLEPRR